MLPVLAAAARSGAAAGADPLMLARAPNSMTKSSRRRHPDDGGQP
ncbi:hypothetical protein [Paenibacillus humicus]|nr:hypothetical protein [Paenibacillus humicus]